MNPLYENHIASCHRDLGTPQPLSFNSLRFNHNSIQPAGGLNVSGGFDKQIMRSD